MQIAAPHELEVDCSSCGWHGVPRARVVRRLVWPTYSVLAVGAVLAETAGFIDLKPLMTDTVAGCVIVGLPLTAAALRFTERCQKCGSRKLRAHAAGTSGNRA